jgi:hypothetical protein
MGPQALQRASVIDNIAVSTFLQGFTQPSSAVIPSTPTSSPAIPPRIQLENSLAALTRELKTLDNGNKLNPETINRISALISGILEAPSQLELVSKGAITTLRNLQGLLKFSARSDFIEQIKRFIPLLEISSVIQAPSLLEPSKNEKVKTNPVVIQKNLKNRKPLLRFLGFVLSGLWEAVKAISS